MRGRGLMLVAGMRAGERRAQEPAAQQQAAQPAAPASPDVTAELQKLTDLHASGALSDEEFAASKKKLLGI
jgi:Short C-terminal domain